MLQRIRDGASGPLAYIVVGVIAVVFGVWGIGSYFTPSSNPVVASAAGTDITHSQLQNAFHQRYQRLRQMLGDQFNPKMFPSDQVRHRVLESMIDQAVMTEHARSMGYQVTDANLLQQIRGNPQFQNSKGDFSSKRYRNLLGQAGIKPASYEARLRKSLMGDQIREIVTASAFAAPPEVSSAYRQANAQRQVSLLTFKPSAFASRVSLDKGQIKNYYQTHPKQFMRPQRVKLAYVLLSADQIKPPAPTQAKLHQLFKQHKKALGTPEKRSADELRISVAQHGDAAARKMIQTALKAARNGQSLKQVAAQTAGANYRVIHSQPKSALPSAVGSALFGLQSGSLSNPVRGDKYWYLIRLVKSTPAQAPSFSDPAVQEKLKAMAHKQAVARMFKAKSKKLNDLAYQAPNGLKTISQKLDLSIQHSGWITRKEQNAKGIGQYKAVRKAAFSDDVLKNKLNSQVLALGDRRRVVLRIADRKAPQRQPLSAVRDQIRQRLRRQKAGELAKQSAQQAMAKVKNGMSMDKLSAADSAATFKQVGYIGHGSQQVDPKVEQAAFDVPFQQAKASGPAYRVVSTQSGAAVLVGVTGARVAQNNAASASGQRAQMAHQLGRYNARLEYSALRYFLRQNASVTIHKNALH